MKDHHYQVEDFLSDSYFIEWVKSPNDENNAFWENWIKTHPEEKSKIAEAREILRSIHFKSLTPHDDEYQEVLGNIQRGKKSETTMPAANRQSGTWNKIFFLRAAIITLCVSGAIFWYGYDKKEVAPVEKQEAMRVVKKNPKGQKSQIQLPDGSFVVLNAESQISYWEGFEGKERAIALEGEAFFEVAKDSLKPFIVEANGIYTKSLGTAFNICAYKENPSVEVCLTQGKVEVGNLATSDKKLILIPGEKATFLPQSSDLQKSLFNYELEIAWQEGVLAFANADLNQVIHQLERWYDVEFILSNQPSEPWQYNGSFENQSLERVLKRLAYIQNFNFKLKGKQVYVTFKN